jgi:hypothetical protein
MHDTVGCPHQRDEVSAERHVVRVDHGEDCGGGNRGVDRRATIAVRGDTRLGRQRVRRGQRRLPHPQNPNPS